MDGSTRPMPGGGPQRADGAAGTFPGPPVAPTKAVKPSPSSSGTPVGPERTKRVRKIVSRACDCCSYSGTSPCEACVKNSLVCSWERPQRKKGPVGTRISEIREQQQLHDGPEPGPPLPSQHQHNPPVDPTLHYVHRAHTKPSPSALQPAQVARIVPSPVASMTSSASPDTLNQGHHPGASGSGSLYEIFAQPDQGLPSLPLPTFDFFAHDPTATAPVAQNGSAFVLPTHDSNHWLPQSTMPYSPAGAAEVIPHNLLQESLHTFFERLHPTMPIFTKAWLQGRIDQGEHYQNRQLRAMLLAMAALNNIQPVQSSDSVTQGEPTKEARDLLEQATRERAVADLGQVPDIDCVMTSFYIFACLFGLQQYSAAWLKLQEAISLIEMCSVHDKLTMESLPADERDRRLRAYLILAITERAFALQRHHPLSIKGRPGRLAPALLPSIGDEGINFLRCHLSLFDYIDENFVECWTGCSGYDCRNLTAESAVALQIKLAQPLEGIDEQHWLTMSDARAIQLADLLVTQQWLRNRVWQLCLRHGFVQQDAARFELGLDLPLSVGNASLSICHSVPKETIEAMGIGFAEKLYDIASTFINMVILWPLASQTSDSKPSASTVSARELINKLLSLLATFRNGKHPYLDPLIRSMSKLPPPHSEHQ